MSQTFCMNAIRLLEDDYFITAVLAKHHEHAVDLSMKIGSFACRSLSELLSLRPDIVVEFAGVEAVEKYAEDILFIGCDLVIASVGLWMTKTSKRTYYQRSQKIMNVTSDVTSGARRRHGHHVYFRSIAAILKSALSA